MPARRAIFNWLALPAQAAVLWLCPLTLGADPEDKPAPAEGDERIEAKATPDLSRSDLDAAVALLDNPSFEIRERATGQLNEDQRLGLRQIEAYLRANTGSLSLEQRERLLAIGRKRFSSSERAAMGVGFGGGLPGRVVVGHTIEGFDSHRQLLPGDLIVEAGGVPLRGASAQNTLRMQIFSRDPGEIMPITVRRARDLLKLELRLGRYAKLNQSGLREFELIGAWRVRTRSLFPIDEPIHPKVDADSWGALSAAERGQKMRFRRLNNGEGFPPSVAAGGAARAARGLGFPGENAQRAGFIIQQLPIGFDMELDNSFPVATPAEELAGLVGHRAQLVQDLQRRTAALARDPDSGREALAELQKRIDVVDRQRLAIEAEIIEAGGQVPVIPEQGAAADEGEER